MRHVTTATRNRCCTHENAPSILHVFAGKQQVSPSSRARKLSLKKECKISTLTVVRHSKCCDGLSLANLASSAVSFQFLESSTVWGWYNNQIWRLFFESCLICSK